MTLLIIIIIINNVETQIIINIIIVIACESATNGSLRMEVRLEYAFTRERTN